MITIRIADVNFRIDNKYKYLPWLCENYIVEDSLPAVEISVTEAEIVQENIAGEFSMGYRESLAVYRKIAEYMLWQDVLLFHSSIVAVDGAAYAFTAVSGTGKSTHSRLWREYLGDRAVMVNDDKPLIRLTDNGAIAYGTPWDGKHRLSSNIAVPLCAVCVLHRGEENRIAEVAQRDVYPKLLMQSYKPSRAVDVPQWMHLADRLSRSVRLYSMYCNMDIDAAKMSYDFMKNK